jgi:hypothetical protein
MAQETVGHQAAVWIPFTCAGLQAILSTFILVLGFAYCDNDATTTPDDPQTLALLARSPFISGVAFATLLLMVHGGKTLIVQKVAFSIVQLINLAFTLTNLITFHVRQDKCAEDYTISSYCQEEKNLRIWMLVIHWIFVVSQAIALVTWVAGLIMYRNETDPEMTYPPQANQLESKLSMKERYVGSSRNIDTLTLIQGAFGPGNLCKSN